MTELFIKYLKGHVGDIYVWGAQGETNITEKWMFTIIYTVKVFE